MKIILCVKNLSAYRKTAREIPAVRTKVIPTDNALSGGCNAAVAISHAADAINKISENAAEMFATAAGKNFLIIDKNAFLVVKLHKGADKMADENKTENEVTKNEDARFDVKSLDEVKDENGNGIFHMRTKTKWIVSISTIMLFLTAILIYATVEAGLGAEMWQVAVWGLCGILALYSVFSKSLAALIFNLVLFFGVSLIPAWQLGYETFRPVIEKLTGAS